MLVKLNYIIKQKIKSIIVKNINKKFFNFILNFIINNNYFAFCYHEITDSPSEFQEKYDLYIEENNFKNQIIFLKRLFKNKNKKKLINQSFLITFDDGYEGSFNAGLKICKEHSIKPIYFLNMHAINHINPILSAQIIYLKKYSKLFSAFCKENSINEPEYLNITICQYRNFISKNAIDLEKIIKFQGKLLTQDQLEFYDRSDDCFFGNHLYKHYNSLSLTDQEFLELVKKNHQYLIKFKNFVSIFAFTNGQPKTCFAKKHLMFLKNLNYKILFSSYGSLYEGNNLIDRIVLTNQDKTESDIKFKIFIAYFRKILFFIKIKLNF